MDNLKTSVDKHGRDEITLNKVYRGLDEHCETAVFHVRVCSLKDKVMVEGSVGIISTFILSALRKRQFLLLSELNEANTERLYAYNHKPFLKHDGRRANVFEEEKAFLF